MVTIQFGPEIFGRDTIIILALYITTLDLKLNN